ncbi:response regulator [Streptomyces vinaceus]|uniref:response regulator n=1 Tax=Streptomyces vinaceus TaxID=1960 RepID=UPI0035DA9F2C
MVDFAFGQTQRLAGQKPDGSAYRVLVVNDSKAMAAQLSQILASEGFEVAATAADGDEAVTRYKELADTLDLVVVDVTLPKKDGVAVVEEILGHNRGARVVMVAATGAQESVKKALEAGAKSYIPTPLDRTKVLERVASALS